MAFPSDSTNTLETKWRSVKTNTGRVKNECTRLNAKASITRKEVLEFANMLATVLGNLDSLTANASTNGLLSYARAQENNASLDLTAEYNTMRTQIVNVQNWIVANFPNTTGELRVYTFDVTKRHADINLDGTQLPAFKTQLTNLGSTIA